MQSVVREFAARTCIFGEGNFGDTAYILTEGSVEISIKTDDAKRVLAVLQPVAVFGEMALLLPDQHRTATAMALVPSKVAEITRTDFEGFFQKSPPLIAALLKALVSRLQKTTQEALGAPDLFLGVAEVLCFLKDHHPRRLDPNVVVERLSHAFRVSAAQITLTLIALESHGLIEMQTIGSTTYLDVIKPEGVMERARSIHRAING
jgi:CRP/FNR family transcriptional regulator, cyclic AMP receptor protein